MGCLHCQQRTTTTSFDTFTPSKSVCICFSVQFSQLLHKQVVLISSLSHGAQSISKDKPIHFEGQADTPITSSWDIMMHDASLKPLSERCKTMQWVTLGSLPRPVVDDNRPMVYHTRCRLPQQLPAWPNKQELMVPGVRHASQPAGVDDLTCKTREGSLSRP